MGVLRLSLALCVVFVHAQSPGWLTGVGGTIAVEAFFVVSGFYMAMILGRDYMGSPGRFWTNRFLRLFPAYWIVILLSLVWAICHGVPDSVSQLPMAVAILLVVANVLMLGSDLVMFIQVNGTDVSFGAYQLSSPPLHTFLLIPQAWTLAIEVAFYVVAPWVVRRSSGTLACYAILALSAKLVLGGFLGLDDPWTYRFLPFEFSYFILGIVVFRYRHKLAMSMRLRNLVASTVAFVFGIGPAIRWIMLQLGEFWFNYAAPLVLVGLISLAIPTLQGVTQSVKWDRRIGDLSFPVYIVHVLVIEVVGRTFDGWLLVGFSVALTLLLSQVLVFVTRPIENLRTTLRHGDKRISVVP